MKKFFFLTIATLMVSLTACSGEKKANDEAQNDAPATEEVTVVEEEATPIDVMAAAEAVSKKIDANEALTDADFGVICDYMISFYEDMQKNPTDFTIIEKYPLVSKLSKAAETFDLENLSADNKAKLEKIQSLKD